MSRVPYVALLLVLWSLSMTAFAAEKPTIIEKLPETEYSLTVNATPSDSRVRIMNIDPIYHAGIKLTPGRYTIWVDKPGYVPYRRWVIIENQDITIQVVLKEARYKLFVNITPAGSRVRIMNIWEKYYPSIRLKRGRYDILVDKHGYFPKRQWIRIRYRDLTTQIILKPDEETMYADIKAGINSQCNMTIFKEYLSVFTKNNGKYWTNIQDRVEIVKAFKQRNKLNTYKGYQLFAYQYPEVKCGKIARERTQIKYWNSLEQTPHVLIQSAEYYKDILDHDKAIQSFEAAMAHNHPGAYAGLGKLYYDEYRKIEKAQTLLTKAVKLKTSDYEAYYYLGLISTDAFKKTNNQAVARKAISYYSTAIGMEGYCSKCYRRRGVLYTLILQIEKAREDLKTARELERQEG